MAVKLRKPQRALLRCLSNSLCPLSRVQLAKLTGVDPTKVGDYIGPRPPDQKEKTKTRWNFPDLLSLGYVEAERHDVDGRDVYWYTITEIGTSALESGECQE